MVFLSMEINFNPFELIPVDSDGLWWGEPFAWTTGMILAGSYYYSKRWIKNDDFENSKT